MASWKDFSKTAGLGDMAYGLSRGAWGGIGAGAGLLKGIWDKSFGDSSDGSLWDYIRTGWNVGKDNADLMATSVIEGVADTVPFVDFNTPRAVAEMAQRDAVSKRGLDPAAAAKMRAMAASGGNVASNAAIMKGVANLTRLPAAFGATGRTAKILRGATSAAVAAPVVPAVVNDYRESDKAAGRQAKAEYRMLAKNLSNMDPASPEYNKIYEVMAGQQHLGPEYFARLARPEHRPAGRSAVDGNNPRASTGPRYSMSPGAQNMAGYGLGGALLGSLFGGKGGWWKWGLLSLLLGSLHNGYGLDKIWNSIGSTIGKGQK